MLCYYWLGCMCRKKGKEWSLHISLSKWSAVAFMVRSEDQQKFDLGIMYPPTPARIICGGEANGPGFYPENRICVYICVFDFRNDIFTEGMKRAGCSFGSSLFSWQVLCNIAPRKMSIRSFRFCCFWAVFWKGFFPVCCLFWQIVCIASECVPTERRFDSNWSWKLKSCLEKLCTRVPRRGASDRRIQSGAEWPACIVVVYAVVDVGVIVDSESL